MSSLLIQGELEKSMSTLCLIAAVTSLLGLAVVISGILALSIKDLIHANAARQAPLLDDNKSSYGRVQVMRCLA
jgi:hypothetical protein